MIKKSLAKVRHISANNHMFGRAIVNKLPESIFENFEISISSFSKIMKVIYLKSHPIQNFDYWLITSNQ